MRCENRKSVAVHTFCLKALIPFLLSGILLLLAFDGLAEFHPIVSLRGHIPIVLEGKAPKITPFDNSDHKPARSYPAQPPIIPHNIEGYQVDLNANRCLSCHARSRASESSASMISITHFVDREGRIRAAVVPQRYFCTQCHVPQHQVAPLVKNQFVDIDKLIQSSD